MEEEEIVKHYDPLLSPTENAEVKPFPWLFWIIVIIQVCMVIGAIFIISMDPKWFLNSILDSIST